MTDEELLDRLAQAERRELEDRAPEWDAVARGEIEPEDAADRIRARGEIDEAALARAIELFAPLSDEFDERLADRLAATARSGDDPLPSEIPTEVARDEGVIDRRDRAWWRGRTAVAILGTLAAAALVLLIARPGDRDHERLDQTTLAAELPAFTLVVAPSHAQSRSAGDDAVRLVAGREATLLLRPEIAHAHAPKVWACLERDGVARPLDVLTTPVGDSGTLQVTTTIPIDVAPGSWSLVTVVATAIDAAKPCALADAPAHRVQKAAVEVASASR